MPTNRHSAGSDPLSQFTSEVNLPPVVAPRSSLPSRSAPKSLKPPSVILETSAVYLDSRREWPTPSHTSERRARRPVKSLTSRIRRQYARSTAAIHIPLWLRRVGDLRQIRTTGAFASLAVGTAAGMLVMSVIGAQPSLPVMASSAQLLTWEGTPMLPSLHVSPPNDAELATHSGPPSIGAADREIGTSGRAQVRRTTARTATPARASAAARVVYRGTLAFQSVPSGARVFVNGEFVGLTPLVLANLPVGSRAVRIDADGYQRWSMSTQVVANRQTRVSATLAPAPRAADLTSNALQRR